MRFGQPQEERFNAALQGSLASADAGLAALCSCLWLTQLAGSMLAGDGRACTKVGALPPLRPPPWAPARMALLVRAAASCAD